MRLFVLHTKSLIVTLLVAFLLYGCGGSSAGEQAGGEETESVAETPIAETPVQEDLDKSNNDDEVAEPVLPIEPDYPEETEQPEESMVATQGEETAETIEVPLNTVDPIVSAEPLETLEPIEAPQPIEAVDLEEAEESTPPSALDDYQVVLSVDSNFKLNKKGVLKVWIGAEENKEVAQPGRAQDETSIPASIGQYAKITPFAPNFKVDPVEYKCVKIDPSGSSVRFTLIPTKKGNLTVSATIELYDNPECTGTPVPKSAAELKVLVVVDRKQKVSEKMTEMGTVLWDKFMIFWGALLALVFGFVLYLIRRKMNKKTGYDGE